ncbi:MAG: NAD(+)/NADH kinase [Salinivenus sp.]
MIYGLAGNPTKSAIWDPVAQTIDWLREHDLDFWIHDPIATGLLEHDYSPNGLVNDHRVDDIAESSDLVLSFGGDGTLLRTAHQTGSNDTPLLGVNIGRLGFLADIEVHQLPAAIRSIEQGQYSIEERMVLEAQTDAQQQFETEWAVNEFVFNRSGSAGLIRIEVSVDGTPLNTYWADGLITATPTGSTAYSLSNGGPIITPGVDAMILTPIAPHTLTVRPIVLPAEVTVTCRVLGDERPYVFAADGRSTLFDTFGHEFHIRRAPHTVNLVKLPDQHFFHTLRSKLMWGAHRSESAQGNPGLDGPDGIDPSA